MEFKCVWHCTSMSFNVFLFPFLFSVHCVSTGFLHKCNGNQGGNGWVIGKKKSWNRKFSIFCVCWPNLELTLWRPVGLTGDILRFSIFEISFS